MRLDAKAEPLPSVERVVPSGIPLKGPLASLLLHCALAFAWIALAPWIPLATSRSLEPLKFDPAKYAGTIFYFRNRLPEISDQGGAQVGKSGSPGRDSFHANQTIRIAHGSVLVPAVVDAPELVLPSVDAPANLVLFAHAVPVGPSPSVSNPVSRAPQVPAPVAAPPAPQIAPALPRQSTVPEPGAVPPPLQMRTAVSKPRLEIPIATGVPPAPALPSELAVRQGFLSAPGAVPPPPEMLIPVRPRTESLAAEVVPPAPVIPQGSRRIPVPAGPGATALQPAAALSHASGETSSAGSGPANASAATPSATSDNNHVAVILTANPGTQVGSAANLSGALALSPAGTNAATGKGHETGTGVGAVKSELAGGSGSAEAGSGFGADTRAQGGLSPAPGAGGAGFDVSVAPAVSTATGVMIHDGQYYVPSFASPPAPVPPGKAPSWAPGRMASVVVVTTPNSGTALDASLRGHRLYTLYLDTPVGEVVFQYADSAPQSAGFERDLTPPAPVFTNIPADLHISKTVVDCVLDRGGKLRNLHVGKTATPDLMPRLLALLREWLFEPARQGKQQVEVIATIGIGTEDVIP